MLAAAPQKQAAGDPLRGFVEQAWDVPKQGIKFSPGVHVGACHFDFFSPFHFTDRSESVNVGGGFSPVPRPLPNCRCKWRPVRSNRVPDDPTRAEMTLTLSSTRAPPSRPAADRN